MTDAFTKCNYCNKEFSGPEPYVQHLQSKAHQQIQQEATKLARNPYSIISTVNGQNYCKECDLSLSGPEPYQQHINGSKHMAQLKKNSILENLKDNDEIKAATSTNDHVTNDDTLVCKVCTKSFSGPICAQQHLKSKKHQRKVQLEEFGNRINGKKSAPSCPGIDTEMYTLAAATKMEKNKLKDKKEKTTGCFSIISGLFKSKKGSKNDGGKAKKEAQKDKKGARKDKKKEIA